MSFYHKCYDIKMNQFHGCFVVEKWLTKYDTRWTMYIEHKYIYACKLCYIVLYIDTLNCKCHPISFVGIFCMTLTWKTKRRENFSVFAFSKCEFASILTQNDIMTQMTDSNLEFKENIFYFGIFYYSKNIWKVFFLPKRTFRFALLFTHSDSTHNFNCSQSF